MCHTKAESLKNLCKGNLLESLYKYFDFKNRDNYYNNLLISKSPNNINELNSQLIQVKRFSHKGLREINRNNNNSKEKIEEENMGGDTSDNMDIQNNENDDEDSCDDKEGQKSYDDNYKESFDSNDEV